VSQCDVIGPVERQLDAYNRQHLEDFLAEFSDDVEIYVFPGEPVLQGKADFSRRYVERFAQRPPVVATVRYRQQVGDKVIDHELLANFAGAGTVREVAAIYTVAAGRIRRVDFVQPE
jgi:hypothetical protein